MMKKSASFFEKLVITRTEPIKTCNIIHTRFAGVLINCKNQNIRIMYWVNTN